MDTKNLQLDETQRVQLDGIVSKMVANNESDSNIQFVVNDFKEKYATKPPGFFQSVVQSVAKPTLKLVSSAQAIGNIANANTPEEINNARTKSYDYGYFGKVSPLQSNLEAVGTGANLGLTVATSGSGTVAKSLGLTGAKALGARALENAVVGGAYQASSNLSDSKPLTQDLGMTSLVSGAIPVAGSAITNAGKSILNKAIPTAEAFINSLIKPLGKDFAYGKNPARGIINEGIIANDINDLGQKVSQKIDIVGKEIGSVGDILDKSGVTLNLVPALDPINKAINNAAKANNTGLFNSLNSVKTALLNDLKAGVDEKGVPIITKGDAKNLISAGYNEARQFLADISTHTRFTGNPSDDKALNMATIRAYGIARDIMNTTADKVDTNLGKQIRNLNERYADLLSANNAINHREIVLKRQNFLNLADKYSLPIAVGGAVATGLITGDFSKAGAVLLSELGAIGATKVLGSTYSKTRIAQFLSKLPSAERQGILNSTPVLKNWYERMTGQVSPNENIKKTNIMTNKGTIPTSTLLVGSALSTSPFIAKGINSIPGESVSYQAKDVYPETVKIREQKGVIDGFDISKWATDPNHEVKVQNIYNNIPDTNNIESLNLYIKSKFPKSPITGSMVYSASQKYNVPVKLIMAIMQQDSGLGTTGLGSRTFNPGNVANNDSKNIQKYKTWDEGVNAVAKWLSILNKNR